MVNLITRLSFLIPMFLIAGCVTLPQYEKRDVTLNNSIRWANAHDNYALNVGQEVVATKDAFSIGIIRSEGDKVSYVVNGKPGPLIDDVQAIKISSNALHHIYPAKKGDRWTVVYDGKLLTNFYEGVAFTRLNENGTRFAFAGKIGNNLIVNLDGNDGPMYDDLSKDGFEFSPDGDHFSYFGLKEDEIFPVINGKKGLPFRRIISPTFSATGGVLGFLGGLTNGYQAVVGGMTTDVYADVGQTLRLSPNGRRYAFVFLKSGKYYINETGKIYGPHEGIGTDFYYSPNGQSFVYSFIKDGKWSAVLDGEPKRQYEFVAIPERCLTSDGKTLFYFAKIDSHFVGVVNEEERYVLPTSPYLNTSLISPKGNVVIFSRAQNEVRCRVNEDEKTWSDVITVYNDSVFFSKEENRYAYIGKKGTKQHFVVDGKISKPYEKITSPIVFSANEKHYCVAGKTKENTTLIIDGYEGEPFPGVIAAGGGIEINDSGECSAWVLDDKTTLISRRVEKRLLPSETTKEPVNKMRKAIGNIP